MVRLARGTGVLELLAVLFANHGHRLIAKRIVGVLADDKHLVGAGGYTISATVTFVGINSDEEVAGAVLVAVVRDHATYPATKNQELS